MTRRIAIGPVAALALWVGPLPAVAQPIAFRVLPDPSRATFKTEAPLETVVGTTAGPGVSGTVMVDPAKPQRATGTVRVDLTMLRTGIEMRDAEMRSREFLDTGNEANRYAVFELRGLEIAGSLEPGREIPARIRGTLTVRGRPVDLTAEARISYVKLTPEQLETQQRFGFTSDNLRVKARFATSFTNHGMQVPQVLFLKLSNEIQLETDLTLVRE